MVRPTAVRPTSRITSPAKTLVTATMLLSRQHHEPSVQSSLDHHFRQRLLCQHLEQCYTQSLEPLKTQGRLEASGSAASLQPLPASKSKASASIDALSQRLSSILSSTGHASSLWGVSLAGESAERDSLLAAFLRAREWDVESADLFLRETLVWRRERGLEGLPSSAAASHDGAAPADEAAQRLGFPDDTIRTLRGTGPDGQPRTIVVIRIGRVTLEAIRSGEELVQWRVAMQEVRARTTRLEPPAPRV